MEKGSGTIRALVRATVYRILADCEDELGVRFKHLACLHSSRRLEGSELEWAYVLVRQAWNQKIRVVLAQS